MLPACTRCDRIIRDDMTAVLCYRCRGTSRDPLGIITATCLAVITLTLAAVVLAAGGWWLLALAPLAPLAAVTAYGYWASVPRRHRDGRGNPIR